MFHKILPELSESLLPPYVLKLQGRGIPVVAKALATLILMSLDDQLIEYQVNVIYFIQIAKTYHS